MQSNDEAVFEVKQKPPVDKKPQKSFSLDDDELDFVKPSLFERLFSVFSSKKPIDDLDMDFSPVNEEPADLDDFEPKKSPLEKITTIFKRPSPDFDIDAEEISTSEKSLPAETNGLDDDFPKPSFLQKLFGGFGKKPDDFDDFDL